MRRALPRLGFVLGLSGATSCIVPDYNIDVHTAGENRFPVRIVEPTELTFEQHCECQPERCGDDGDGMPQCPLPQATNLPHLLDPNLPEFQFCICPEGEFDQPFPGAILYAEDQDGAEDQGQIDQLYAALLLDLEPGDDPRGKVGYRQYVDPRAELIPVGLSYAPPERPKFLVRQIVLADVEAELDLCNGSGFGDMSPGFHTLTVLVTDRPWFEQEIFDEDGKVIETATHEGVPDVARGATYDAAHYSFYCLTKESEDQCGCEVPPEE